MKTIIRYHYIAIRTVIAPKIVMVNSHSTKYWQRCGENNTYTPLMGI